MGSGRPPPFGSACLLSHARQRLAPDRAIDRLIGEELGGSASTARQMQASPFIIDEEEPVFDLDQTARLWNWRIISL